MKTMAISTADQRLGDLVAMAKQEPVLVTQGDQPVGVFLSMADAEDTLWGERAHAAHREGYIGAEASQDLVARLLDAKA